MSNNKFREQEVCIIQKGAWDERTSLCFLSTKEGNGTFVREFQKGEPRLSLLSVRKRSPEGKPNRKGFPFGGFLVTFSAAKKSLRPQAETPAIIRRRNSSCPKKCTPSPLRP